MDKLLVRLDEAKNRFDWQDLLDLMDQFVREAEKIEKTVVELEEGNQKMILELDIKSRQLREALKENEELKLKIKMLERG